jgi:hypothetical protein
MAKKSSVSKAELDELKLRGFVEGNPDTIPENISPVIKSKLLAEMGEDSSGSTPGEAGGENALAGRHDRQQDAMAAPDDRGHVDNATGGVKK